MAAQHGTTTTTTRIRPLTPIRVVVADILVGQTAEYAWTLYEAAFRDLAALAIQRHLMHRSEFDDVITDRRIQKYLAFTPDWDLVGLTTYTNVLESMPLISPQYFARRWPDLHATGRIWYCGFVAVAPDAQGGGAFRALVEAMYRVAANQGGVISLDVCRHNGETRHLLRAIRLLLHRVSDGAVGVENADAQTYMVYDTRAQGRQ